MRFFFISAYLFIFSLLVLKAQCDLKECKINCPTTSITSQSSSSNDEFKPFNENETIKSDENFHSFNDSLTNVELKSNQYSTFDILQWPLIALFFTLLAGIFVRYKFTRNFRHIFLILSIIFLGFYNSACPCPISSFSYLIIGLTDGFSQWIHTIWFLGLIPLTYVFGKTWCGWVCHLGALQEFLFKFTKKDIFSSLKAQKVMKIIRLVLLFVLIIQLIATQTYLFDIIDPFRVAFNLGFGANLTGWILLALLLVSSIFIHRPFCKSACPIGLVLGLIAKIPGASVLGSSENCISCNSGYKYCRNNAINKINGKSIIDNKECILCGECLDCCKSGAVKFYRKNKIHNTTSILCTSKKDDQ